MPGSHTLIGLSRVWLDDGVAERMELGDGTSLEGR